MNAKRDYKFFVGNITKRDKSNRSLTDRYKDAHDAVSDAYNLLEQAIIFDAYDFEDELKLNDLRKRLFHFQRLTLEKWPDILKKSREIQVEKINKSDRPTWRDFYSQLADGHTVEELRAKAEEWRELANKEK